MGSNEVKFRIIVEKGKLWQILVLLYPYVPAALIGAQWTDGRYSSETKGDGTETYGGHDLKNLSVFLNVKKGRSQPGNKGLCFVCDCNSGECQRTNAHTAAAAGVRGGGTTAAPAGALALGAKTRAFLIHCCCLSSDSTSHGCRRADADSPPPPPRRLSTSVQSNKLNSSRARNASSSTSRMLQTLEIVAKQHKIFWKTTCLAPYPFDLKPIAFK